MANEADNARAFVEQTLETCAGFGLVRFFAVLDGASRDATREILEQLAEQEPRLTVVWTPGNSHVAGAYIRGYREALAFGASHPSGTAWILEIDAGFSHRPEEIPRFFPLMLAGYDCVFGSRFVKDGRMSGNLKRRVVSWGGSKLTNLVLGTRLKDMTSGFEMFTREALAMALERGVFSKAHFFQTEVKVHCRDLRIAEVPITYRCSSSNLGTGPVTESLRQLFRLLRLRISGRL